MTTPDDKLLELLKVVLHGTDAFTLGDSYLEPIKQAFTEAGYIYIPQVEIVTRYERGMKPEVFMANGKEVMTGQEWLQRFEQEFEPEQTDCAEFYAGFDDECEPKEHARRSGRFEVMVEALDAAKRASGVQA